MNMNSQKLLKKIKGKKARVAVIGLGYVGLPLALLLVNNGFTVDGYVRNPKKKTTFNNGESGIGFDTELQKALHAKKFTIHMIGDKNLQTADVYIISVPTPVTKQKKPDLSDLKQVAKRLSQLDLTDKLIINESTVAPFTTKNILGNLGKNYFLVCSPERIDPGGDKTVENIPKVIGGINNESLELGVALYKKILKKKIVIAKSMEISEMSKMLENTYRAVNIALINEFARLADTIDIDILDVINSAKTKWSFQAHYPGIGVGGHCIPVDPYYILKLANDKNISMNVVKKSLITNEKMPEYVLHKIIKYYKKNMRILIYGIAYKKDVTDLRESPVLILCKLLKKKDIPFTVYDPLIPAKQIQQLRLTYGKPDFVDIFVIGTDHTKLKNDYKL